MKKRTNKNETSAATTGNSPVYCECAVAELEHCSWNPRTPEELSPGHIEMVKLVDSVKKLGVVQSISVWDTPDGHRYCIAGNRRLEAAKLAGLKMVPAVVYYGIDEATAMAITRAENEVRFGVSPLMDAKMISEFKGKGYSQAEIAAILGTSEARVCRRVKLLDLIPEARENFAAAKVETLALEEFAKYPADLQKKALKSLYIYPSRQVTVNDVRDSFYRLTQQLSSKDWIFSGETGKARLERCSTCGLCSGNQPDLFDVAAPEAEGGERVFLGHCFDTKCYKKLKLEAKQDALPAAVVKAGGTEADAAAATECEYYQLQDYAAKKSKKNPFAYVHWEDWEHRWQVRWGGDPEKAKAKAAQAKEDAKAAAAAEEERRRLDAAIEARRDEVKNKVISAFAGKDFEADELREKTEDAIAKKLAKMPSSVLAPLMATLMAREIIYGDEWDDEYCRTFEWLIVNGGAKLDAAEREIANEIAKG